MSKPLFGLLLGGVLGIFDGLTAYFTPEVRNQLVGIVIGSTFKGARGGALDRLLRAQGPLAVARSFLRPRRRARSSRGSSPRCLTQWQALLLRDHASRRAGGRHRRIRDAEVPQFARQDGVSTDGGRQNRPVAGIPSACCPHPERREGPRTRSRWPRVESGAPRRGACPERSRRAPRDDVAWTRHTNDAIFSRSTLPPETIATTRAPFAERDLAGEQRGGRRRAGAFDVELCARHQDRHRLADRRFGHGHDLVHGLAAIASGSAPTNGGVMPSASVAGRGDRNRLAGGERRREARAGLELDGDHARAGLAAA